VGCATTMHVDMVKSFRDKMIFKIGSTGVLKRVLGMASPTGTWTYLRQELAFEKTQQC
jgi:hypothetical protein